jgi:hypothetical protein
MGIDLSAHLIRINSLEYSFPPLSSTALGILETGGLVAYVRRKLGLPDTVPINTFD